MRRNIMLTALLSLALFVSAQVEYDALRLSQTELTGTARYMGLGGAMGALGADASALKDNPAGLGVYRSSEITGTLNLSSRDIDPIEWYGNTTRQDRLTTLKFDNVSYVNFIPTGNNSGLLSSNIAFSYQKLADYNKSFAFGGNNMIRSFTDYLANYSSPSDPIEGVISYKNYDMPWLTVLASDGKLINEDGMYFTSVLKPGERVDASYFFNQRGSLNEYAVGWGGNYDDRLFVGANVNVRRLDYSLSTTMSEKFSEGGSFKMINNLLQSGIGMNAKVGLIYLPTNFLRLGLALHTPSLTYVSEESSADLHSTLIPATETNPALTPVNSQSFNLWTPMQVQASAALMYQQRGFISAEYNFINYQGARFQKTQSSTQYFADVNHFMKDVLNNVHVLKLGAEVRVTPNWALRTGFANITPAVNADYKEGKLLVRNSVTTNTEYFDQIYNTNYFSVGTGYRTSDWFVDFTYFEKVQEEKFMPYQDKALLPVQLYNKRSNFVFTAGLRM